ncbi:hypothetical protein H4R35_002934 [Dimargaris xerosporica]|nr:hypothetical protein H4R35_002934 [Dimargaris xerosporica]
MGVLLAITFREEQAGDTMVEIPRSLLLTRSLAIRRWATQCGLSRAMVDDAALIHEQAVLALVVALEQRQLSRSSLAPYLNILPSAFATMPLAHLTPAPYPADTPWFATAQDLALVQLLPFDMAQALWRQKQVMDDGFRSMTHTLVPLLRQELPFADWCWAWMAVNTRCISLHSSSGTIARDGSKPATTKDSIALAPLLDLLNHSQDVQVDTVYDERSGSFAIRARQPTQQGRQAFINYGPHDNAFLCLEYGFVLPKNRYDVVVVDNLFPTALDPFPASGSPHLSHGPVLFQRSLQLMALGLTHAHCLFLYGQLRPGGTSPSLFPFLSDYVLQTGEASYRLTSALQLVLRMPPIRHMPLSLVRRIFSPQVAQVLVTGAGSNGHDFVESVAQLDRYFERTHRGWLAWLHGQEPGWGYLVQPLIASQVQAIASQALARCQAGLKQVVMLPASLQFTLEIIWHTRQSICESVLQASDKSQEGQLV